MALFGRKNEAVSVVRVNYDGKNAEKGLGSLKKTIATVISAVVIKQVAQYTFELGKLGAQATLVEKNFEGFSKRVGLSSEQAIAKLRKASLGMVSDIELQQRAMQAMIAGVDFSDIITAMEFVSKFALATGTDVNQKMMTVFTGLARGSAQFLDDVGIQVMGAEDVVGAAIDQMKEKMDQFATSTDDAAVSAAQFETNLENLATRMQKKLLPAFNAVVKIANSFLDAIESPELVRLNNEIEGQEVFLKQLYDRLEKGPSLFDKFFSRINQGMGGVNFAERTDEEIKKSIKSVEDGLKELKRKRDQITGASETGTIISEPKKPAGETKASKKARERRQKENKEISEWLDDQVAIVEDHREEFNEITVEQWEERNAIIKEALNAGRDSELVAHEEKLALYEHQKQLYPELQAQINILISEESDRFRKEQLEKDEQLQRERIEIAQQGLNAWATVTSSLMALSDARTNRDLRNLEKRGLSQKKFEKEREKILAEADKKRKAFARAQQGIAIAEATINAVKMGVGAGAEAVGGPFTRILAMGTALAAGMIEVATIEAQNFQTGRLGDKSRSRSADTIPAMLGKGETVVSAPQSAMHEETLRAIQNNTANTAMGLSSGSGRPINIYGASTEQILNVITQSQRTNSTGMLI